MNEFQIIGVTILGTISVVSWSMWWAEYLSIDTPLYIGFLIMFLPAILFAIWLLFV